MPTFLIVAGVLLVILISCLRIVSQGNACITEFLGKYHNTWEAGLHIKVPLLEQIVKRVTLKEQVLNSPPQPVITKDNVTMQIDTVVYFRVFDPKLYTYGAVNPIEALDTLSATTLRNIVGELDLDGTLTSRDLINSKMTQILDAATDAWGIKVLRVEIQNIIPPAAIQEAMEKQMKAERDKRETILLAEAEKNSMVTRAEGVKQAAILRAEGEAEAKIAEARGEAEAVLLVRKAEADGLRLLKEADPNKAVLILKQFEAVEKMADGRAAKIIIPTDMVNMVNSAVTFSEATGLGEPTSHEHDGTDGTDGTNNSVEDKKSAGTNKIRKVDKTDKPEPKSLIDTMF